MTVFDRFFKPKWQHDDPQVRRHSVATLADGDPLLLQLARDDPDPETRRAALARCMDLSLISERIEQDSEAGVREYASQRLRDLLTGNIPDHDRAQSPSLQDRLQYLDLDGLENELIEHLARQAREPQLRLAALARLDDPQLRADLAINDAAAEVRQQALEELTDLALLERVAKQARGRDKRIFRTARERLDAAAEQHRQQQQRTQLCDELQHLHWDGETGTAVARFARLRQQWTELGGDDAADAPARDRYQQAEARFLEQQQRSIQHRQQCEAICRQLQQMLDEPPAAMTADIIHAELSRTAQDWQAAGNAAQPDNNDDTSTADDDTTAASSPAIIEQRRLTTRYQQARDALLARANTLQSEQRSTQQALRKRRQVLKNSKRLLQRTGLIQVTEVDAAKQSWRQLQNDHEQHASSALPEAAQLQQSFTELITQLEQRLTRQHQQKDQERGELQQLVTQFEQALQDGELQRANDFDAQARQRLKQNISLSAQQMAALRKRLDSGGDALQQLRGWQRWGNDQARTQLIEQAEALAESSSAADADPLQLAKQVREARTAWQRLNAANPSPRAQWKRFNDACERAYAPAQAHFDTQAEQRATHLRQRQALCDDIQQFDTTTDWEQVDWAEVTRFERSVQDRWRNLGPVDRSAKKAIDKRYRTLLEQLQTRLKPQIERELARRKTLLQRVQLLADSDNDDDSDASSTDDIAAAIDTAKQAQQQWRPPPGTVVLPRRQEQALWKQFRAACDAVFARRQAARDAETQQRSQHREQCAGLCQQMEALAKLANDEFEPGSARTQAQTLEQAWDELQQPPKKLPRALQERFQKAIQQLEQRYQQHQQQLRQHQLDTLHARAGLCRRLEQQLNSNDSDADLAPQAHQANDAWAAFATADGSQPVPAALQQRFERVCAALQADLPARQALATELEENATVARALCLQLEVLSGSETPAEFAAERMQYQVQRLSSAMAERGKTDTVRRAEHEHSLTELQQTWCGLGVLPTAQADALQQRFQQALEYAQKNPS